MSWPSRNRLTLFLCAALAASCGQPYDPAQPDQFASVEQELKVCQGPTVLKGIDVSSYQGNIDWAQVAGSGIKWAYAKATENLSYQDAYFNHNWSGMKNNGVVRGAYHFFHPNVSGKQQADYYLNFVGTLSAGDLPPMLDWEISGGASAATAVANAQEFIDEIAAKTGRQTVIYTSPGIWSGFGISTNFGNNPLFVAHYLFCTGGTCCPTMPTGWSSWVMWQWADNGSIPGISGNVDEDIFNGDMTALTNLGGGAVCTGPIGHPVGAGGSVTGGTCSGGAPAVTAPTGCGALTAGNGLTKGKSITSCDGRFSLIMQSDGNLVQYSNGIAMFATMTVNHGEVAVMQGDGNLVVYDSGGCPVWASKTDGHNGSSFALQDDGNLVIYDTGSHALWSSGSGPIGAKPAATCGVLAAGEALAPGSVLEACGGCFNLQMQSDGNLVVYKKNGTPLWSSATAMTDGYVAEVQADGNVVLQSKAGCFLWSSQTGGHNGAHLSMQDDGNLVVYDTGNHPLWASMTVSCQGGCNCNPPPPDGGMGTGGGAGSGGGSGTGGGHATGGGSGTGGGSMGAGGGVAGTGGGVSGTGGGSGSTGGGEFGAGGGSGSTGGGTPSATGGGMQPGPVTPKPSPDQIKVHGTVGCSSTSGGFTAFALLALLLRRRKR
jgi:GH25 family lysozyme M1 (1,4-beta-N-acetylmuramidase)